MPIFKPGASWLVRENAGEFTTNRSVDALVDFYRQQLPDSKLIVDEMSNLNRRFIVYIMPGGDVATIGFIDQGPDGVEVNIQIDPEFY